MIIEAKIWIIYVLSKFSLSYFIFSAFYPPNYTARQTCFRLITNIPVKPVSSPPPGGRGSIPPGTEPNPYIVEPPSCYCLRPDNTMGKGASSPPRKKADREKQKNDVGIRLRNYTEIAIGDGLEQTVPD